MFGVGGDCWGRNLRCEGGFGGIGVQVTLGSRLMLPEARVVVLALIGWWRI